MNAHFDGGPAFPTPAQNVENDGMRLRDYFAIHASDEDIKAQAEVIRARMAQAHGIGVLPDNWHCTARYMHADAMLKVRQS